MSKIDEMLKNEKVEWRKLGEVCELVTDFTAAGSFASNAKNVKYLKEPSFAQLIRTTDLKSNFSNKESFVYVDEYAFNYLYRVNLYMESLVLPNVGNCGEVYYVNKEKLRYKENVLGPNALLLRSAKYNMRFLYYLFHESYFQKELYKITSKTGQGKFNKTDLKQIRIPIPSIETQEKIVEILNKFTNYVTELQAELQFRTKQYEYYRDMLLSEDYLNKISKKIDKFENNKYKITTVELGSIVEIKNGKDWKSLSTGTIPVYGSGGNMGIYVDKYAYNKPTVLIPRKGSIENIFYLEEPFWNVDTIFYTQIDEGKIIPKYFYYFMQNYDLKSLSTDSTRPSLTQQIVNKIKIKLPPIKIQNKVVKVLDKFQALLEDTKGLLPTEIEQRRKQYEYYREKLLTFDTDCGSQSVSQSVNF